MSCRLHSSGRTVSQLTYTFIVTLEEKAAYSKIIDAILKSRDLSTVTPKQVRKDLQAETSRDLTQHKVRVDRNDTSS